MVAEVDHFLHDSSFHRKSMITAEFTIASIENAQLKVREKLYEKIEQIYRKFPDWKFQGLIMSRDAQLHVNASSLPSLTVKKRNIIFPVSHPVKAKN